jgi:hypothetical protein
VRRHDDPAAALEPVHLERLHERIDEPEVCDTSSPPMRAAAWACGLAGRGLTISSPSMISATLVSGTCISSS